MPMNGTCAKSFVLIFVVCLTALFSIHAAEGAEPPPYLLTDRELDDLLAPVALYPDPLLAVILPAATYPMEVADAAAWLRGGRDPYLIDDQNWAEPVRAIAHYPKILYMMADNMDWTAALGEAFLNQPEDVTRSIQRLRWQARAVGNLVSNSQQTVIIEDDYIEIIPAQPQYIYIPQYDYSVVYVQRWYPGIPPFITFGIGLVIGGWLSMDFDWGHHHVIYHGWNRHGWVNNARPYVHITNVYINRSRPYINQTWRHDPSHGSPDRYWGSRPGIPSGRHANIPEIRGKQTIPARPPAGAFAPRSGAQSFSNRGKESRGAVQAQPAAPAPGIIKKPEAPAPSAVRAPSRPSPERERVQPPRAPSTPFGGYRGTNETRSQSLRGESSRKSSAAPESRGKAPSDKGGARESKGGGERKESKEGKKGPSR